MTSMTKIPTGQTLYDPVNIGSIIEKEAMFNQDRPIIAGVVDNRLAQGMLLQVNPTVMYGLGLTSGEPTAAQLATDTPYNTYIHAGLPPTPIGNPGVASL